MDTVVSIMLRAALVYAARDWRVFPLNTIERACVRASAGRNKTSVRPETVAPSSVPCSRDLVSEVAAGQNRPVQSGKRR